MNSWQWFSFLVMLMCATSSDIRGLSRSHNNYRLDYSRDQGLDKKPQAAKYKHSSVPLVRNNSKPKKNDLALPTRFPSLFRFWTEYKFVRGDNTGDCRASGHICHFMDSSTQSIELVDLDSAKTPDIYHNGLLMVRRPTSRLCDKLGLNCSNYNESPPTGKFVSPVPSTPSYLFSRHNAGGDNTKVFHRKKAILQGSRGMLLKTAGQIFKSCVQTGMTTKLKLPREKRLADARVFHQLPRVLIVLTTTKAIAYKDQNAFQRVVNHWKCYAKIHSYNVSTNLLNVPNESVNLVQFMNSSQYTVFLNANSVSLNMSRSLEPFLLRGKSVVLQFSSNLEVSSDIYVMRNDHRAQCFLRYIQFFHPWRFSPSNLGNSLDGIVKPSVTGTLADNVASLHGAGARDALGGAILGLLPDRAVESCLETSPNLSMILFPNFLLNESTIEAKLWTQSSLSTEQQCLMRLHHLVYTLGTAGLRFDLGVYILWGGEGLSRPLIADSQPTSTSQPESCFSSSDFIQHATGPAISDKYMPSKSNQCLKAYIKDVWRGKGESEVCEWVSPGNEIQKILESDYCYFNSPACNDPVRVKVLLTRNLSTLTTKRSASFPEIKGKDDRSDTNNGCVKYLHTMQLCNHSSKLFALTSFRTSINYSIY